MIDHPDRLSPRFPPVIQPQVKNEITDALERIGADFGYSSAACGADILFIEAMLERSAEINIVLPFNKADFIETSVRFAGPDWLARFDRVMEKAKKIYYATEEGYLNDDVLFNYGAAQIFGMGILRAKQLESDVLLLSVADSGSEIQTGGTLENIFSWKDCGYETELIDLSKIRNQAGQYNNKQRDDTSDNLNVAHPHAFTQAVSIARDIRTMLFADVVGFSKIGEAEAPSFFVDFLNEIADMIHSYPVGPAFYNTWGDGLFLVYQDIEAAADIALLLRDTVKNKDWQSVGLPEETSIRIGMHAGPVYSAHDPIVNRQNYYGSHVNRAARIEPVTTPGSVFISEQTACLLALTNNDSFTCDYLGPIDLAKKYGSGVLYRLRRKNEIE
jgi:class 3 adenylate cyclase